MDKVVEDSIDEVDERIRIRCLDQSIEEGTEGATCGVGAHLKRPMQVHTRIPHCKPGPDGTYRDKWCDNEWINDLRPVSIFRPGHASNLTAESGYSTDKYEHMLQGRKTGAVPNTQLRCENPRLFNASAKSLLHTFEGVGETRQR